MVNKKQNKENKEILDRLQYGFSVQRIIHKGWEEYSKIKDIKTKGFKLTNWFGKYQYILRSEKGEISIIKIKKFGFSSISPLKRKNKWVWEMWANDNPNLFTDTQTFPTKEKAFKVAKKYLMG